LGLGRIEIYRPCNYLKSAIFLVRLQTSCFQERKVSISIVTFVMIAVWTFPLVFQRGVRDTRKLLIFYWVFRFCYKVHDFQNFAECVTFLKKQACFHPNFTVSLYRTHVVPFFTDRPNT